MVNILSGIQTNVIIIGSSRINVKTSPEGKSRIAGGFNHRDKDQNFQVLKGRRIHFNIVPSGLIYEFILPVVETTGYTPSSLRDINRP